MVTIWCVKTSDDREQYKDEPSVMKIYVANAWEIQATRSFIRTTFATNGAYWMDGELEMPALEFTEGGIIARYNHVYDVWITENPPGHWSDIVISFEEDL